jgi:hypothetical protein
VLVNGRLSIALTTRIAPFVGAVQESWESFPDFKSTVDTLGHRSFLSDPAIIFQGNAKIAHPKAAIYLPDTSNYYLGSSGPAQVYDGEKGVGLVSTGPQPLPDFIESASITFFTPLGSFGGYWGAGTDFLYDPEVIKFQFFDANDLQIGMDSVVYTRSHLIDESQMIFWGDGQLQWAGWQFDVPMKRVVFGGGAIVADFLQANPIPEPSSLAVVFAAGITAPFYRRSRLDRAIA